METKRKSIAFFLILTVVIQICSLLPAAAGTSLDELYDSTGVSSIDIQLHPVTSDYPSVMIGLHGATGTKIYGENSGFENTSIWLVQSESGEYFCSYSTESIRYPLENGWTEIEPEVIGEFVIKVYSTERISHADRSGVKLNVFNETDLPAHILIYNDDEVYPRVKTGAVKGKTLINRLEKASWPDIHTLAVNKTDASLTTFFPEYRISSMALSPDGTKAAYEYSRNKIDILDLENGQVERTLVNGSYNGTNPRGIAYSPDGSYIAYGYFSDIILKNIGDGSEIYRIRNSNYNSQGHSNTVKCIAISADGEIMASGSDDRKVKLWNADNGSILYTLSGHTDGISSIAVSADGKTIVSGSRDRTVKVWNGENGTLVHTLSGHTNEISSVAISADGNTIVSGSLDRAVKIWDAASGTLIRTLTGHSDRVTSVAISSDNQIMASASYDKTIKVWNILDGQLIRAIKVQSTADYVKILPDNQTIISKSGKGISSWNVQVESNEVTAPIVSMKYPVDGTYYKKKDINVSNDLIPIAVDIKNINNPREARLYVNDKLNVVLPCDESDFSISGYWDNFNMDPGNYSLRCEVEDEAGEVYTSESINIVMEGIALNKKYFTVEKGGMAEALEASIYLAGDNNWTDIQWEIDDTIAALTHDGQSAVISPVSPNGGTVRVKLMNGDDILSSDMAMFLVKDHGMDNLLLNKSHLKLSESGDPVVLDAQIVPRNLTFDRERINLTWSTSDEAVVSIEENGTSAVVTPLQPGNAVVGISTEDGTMTALCEINVVSGPVIRKTYLTVDESMNKQINVVFSKAIDEGTDYNNIFLKDSDENIINIEKSVVSESLVLDAASNLINGEQYTVVIPAGAVTDMSGNPLSEEYVYPFTSVAPFDQNDAFGGYEPGAYDRLGIQPTLQNWTRQSRYEVGTDYEVKWTFEAGEEVRSSIVIDSENIMYYTTGDYLYALDNNGNSLWAYPVPEGSEPVIGKDRTIYVGSIDRNLYAINPDGTRKWKLNIGDGYSRIISAPAIGADGTIYAGSTNASLYAINPDGTIKWTYLTGPGGVIKNTPIIGKSGTIYVSTENKNVYAINPNGSLKWEYSHAAHLSGKMAIDNEENIYIGDIEGKLYSLNASGSMRWAALDKAYSTRIEPVAISKDGTVYANSFNNNFNTYNKTYEIRKDGSIAGERNLNALFAIDKNNTFLLGLSAIKQDGSVSWQGELVTNPATRPTIGHDSAFYFANDQGRIYAMRRVQNTDSPGKGDFNGDGKIDLADLKMMSQAYGTLNPDFDMNDDGVVDIDDLVILAMKINLE